MGQRGIAQMVFHQYLSQSPTRQKSHTLIVIACNTLLLLCIDSRVYTRSTVRPREVKNSATASASRLEQPGLLILWILHSGAYVYTRAYSQYTVQTAAGPVILYAICTYAYAYSI